MQLGSRKRDSAPDLHQVSQALEQLVEVQEGRPTLYSVSYKLKSQTAVSPLRPEAKAEGVSAGIAFGLARLGREDQVRCPVLGPAMIYAALQGFEDRLAHHLLVLVLLWY